jgi:hypothetical protein
LAEGESEQIGKGFFAKASDDQNHLDLVKVCVESLKRVETTTGQALPSGCPGRD